MKWIYNLGHEEKLCLSMSLFCLGAAITGLLIPHTVTPWFWFGMSGLFGITTIICYLYNKRS